MKKIVIPILVLFLIGIFVMWNNRVVSTIYLDINPSFKIGLDKKNKIKVIKPINEDAKKVINDVKGKEIKEGIEKLVDNITSNDFLDNDVTIIMYTDGIDKDYVGKSLEESFVDKGIHIDIVNIEKITDEDIKLAKQYNITPTKASYISSTVEEYGAIDIDYLKDKSVDEIKETKEKGKYCDEGYILEGDWCHKEIGREDAIYGMVCPIGYYQYDGICYEEVPSYDGENLLCTSGSELSGSKCLNKRVEEPMKTYECTKGELAKADEYLAHGVERPICVDKTNAKAPTLRCLLEPHIMIDGKCYVGPAPVINGGCPNNDKLINGGCYSLDPEDQWQCPDGGIYERSKGLYIELCPDTYSYSKPIIVSTTCNDGFTLENDECVKYDEEDAWHERLCPTGYTLLNDRCLNKDNVKEKESGYYCSRDDARVKNTTCIIYDIIEAKNA